MYLCTYSTPAVNYNCASSLVTWFHIGNKMSDCIWAGLLAIHKWDIKVVNSVVKEMSPMIGKINSWALLLGIELVIQTHYSNDIIVLEITNVIVYRWVGDTNEINLLKEHLYKKKNNLVNSKQPICLPKSKWDQVDVVNRWCCLDEKLCSGTHPWRSKVSGTNREWSKALFRPSKQSRTVMPITFPSTGTKEYIFVYFSKNGSRAWSMLLFMKSIWKFHDFLFM